MAVRSRTIDFAVDTEADRVLAIDEALCALEQISARLGQIVECRFFAGMTEEETAAALGVSLRTVQREWMRARAWLVKTLGTATIEDRLTGAGIEDTVRSGRADRERHDRGTGMNVGRRRIVDAIFEEALDLPPDAQAALLDARCGADAALRHEVMELLRLVARRRHATSACRRTHSVRPR